MDIVGDEGEEEVAIGNNSITPCRTDQYTSNGCRQVQHHHNRIMMRCSAGIDICDGGGGSRTRPDHHDSNIC